MGPFLFSVYFSECGLAFRKLGGLFRLRFQTVINSSEREIKRLNYNELALKGITTCGACLCRPESDLGFFSGFLLVTKDCVALKLLKEMYEFIKVDGGCASFLCTGEIR